MYQAFLAETEETGSKNRCVIEARMFSEESLGKIKFRVFPKRLKALITLEQVNTTEWSKKKERKNLN